MTDKKVTEFKGKARRLSTFLSDHKVEMQHSILLHAVAAMEGHRSWQAMIEAPDSGGNQQPAIAASAEEELNQSDAAFFLDVIAGQVEAYLPVSKAVEVACDVLPMDKRWVGRQIVALLNDGRDIDSVLPEVGFPRFVATMVGSATHCGRAAEGFRSASQLLQKAPRPMALTRPASSITQP